MPGGGRPDPQDPQDPRDPPAPGSLDPLLREHLALRGELAAALDLLLRAGPAADGATRLEERCAGLLDRVLAHLSGVSFEAMRRGMESEALEAAYDRLAGTVGSIDPGHPLAGGLPGGAGAAPAAREAWEAGAEAGRAAAQYLLGLSLVFNPERQEDAGAGVLWLERSAEQEYAPAALALSRVLETGALGRPDPVRVRALLRTASDLGLAEASFRLAMRMVHGDGVRSDPAAAMELLEEAAAAGHPEAQLEWGRLRAVGGPGVEVDHAEAHRCLSGAAARHRLLAREWLDRYGAMSPREYLNATWVEAWTPTEIPPPARSGPIGLVVSLGLVGLLVAAAAGGNSLGLFLLFLFAAVLLHEAGHWLVARMVGIPILVFSVGVGPLVRSFPWGGGRLPMRIDLRLLPLLGSVRPYAAPRGIWDYWQEKFRREDAGEPPPPIPDLDRTEEPEPAFLHAPRPRRLAFLLGGLAVNLLLAVACLWAYENGSEAARLWTVPVAGPVPAGSLAEAAGIREGDRFLTVDGTPVRGFFEVQRRLAPADPAGGVIPLVVRRDGAEVALRWTPPPAPPPGEAALAHGLVPVETWTVRRIHGGATLDLRPGDAIVEFEGEGGPVLVTAPGARRLFEEAFSKGSGGPVRLALRRAGVYREAVANPSFGGEGGGRPPFDFERVREVGPARGLGEVVGGVFRFGWRSVIGLPRAIVASFREAPTPEEQGALLAAVRSDPWAAMRTFALLNAFLLFLNLVPIPPLDGFQVLCCLLEMGARRPLPRGGVVLAARVGWVIMGLWLLLNVVLVLRDLAGTVL